MGFDSKLYCIIMASGYGKRFGSDKLTASFKGVPLCEYVFANHPSELFHSTIVVARTAEVALSACAHHLTVAENLDDKDDIAATIRLGMSFVPKDAFGCMFSVCDMPYFTQESVNKLTAAFAQDRSCIVAPRSADGHASPVIFPQSTFEELASLPPNTSGNAVIKRHLDKLRLVDIDENELRDIDLPQDML